MRKQRDAKYFGYAKGSNKFVRVASLALLLLWIGFLQDSHAQTQQQNYNAVGGTMAGVGVMTAIGGGICAAVTAGGCVPIAIAGGIMAGAGGTIGAMNQASGASHGTPCNHAGGCGMSGDMPDSEGNYSDGHGSGMGSGGGGGDAFDGPGGTGSLFDWIEDMFYNHSGK